MFNMEKLVEVIGVVNRLIEAIDNHTAALEKNTQAIEKANAHKPAQLIGEGPPP